MNRKKKLLIIQISFLVLGLLIVAFTFYQKDSKKNTKIVSKEIKEQINKNLNDGENDSDVFYNVSYSGLDLSGNRYILKSREARTDRSQPEIINLKTVDAFFYFKDGTVLKIKSRECIYNNKTFNMKFSNEVKANYEGRTLFSENAEYNNSEKFLLVSDKVIIKDLKSEMRADKLFFDLNKNTLDISSYNDNNINANINYNEKKF